MPAKIIILRHGEKKNAFELCSTGLERSQALAAQYLGKGAAKTLFAPGESPAAFFAITLHTIELASPAAQSWGAPLIAYTAVPIKGSSWGDSGPVLDARTQQAAKDVLDAKWNGKTVVMVWEHKHIAEPGLAASLANLLGFAGLAGVPDKWQGENYDYFWIVTYAGGKAASFTAVKQSFDAPYDDLPQNDWGKKPKMGADCES
jgi:hypothetical protein